MITLRHLILSIIIPLGLIILTFIITSNYPSKNSAEPRQSVSDGQPNTFGIKPASESSEVIFNQGGVTVTFYWLAGREGVSNEESEIYVLNQTNDAIEITNPSLTYSIINETFSPASEGFEAYASATSYEKVDRVLIYSSRPEKRLFLKAGQQGNLHYHYLFNDNFAGSNTQTAHINLTLIINNKTHQIKKQLSRKVIPTNEFQSTAIHPVEEQIEKYGSESAH